MIIYVRARKDKALLDYVNEKVYNKSLEIRTLEGKRKDELMEKIYEISKNPEDFTLILLGREDRKWIKNDFSNSVVKVYFVPKQRVRNTKPKAIVKEIEMAKSRFILDIKFEEDYYKLGKRSNFILDLEPYTDIYLILYKKYKEILSDHLEINNYPLVWHVKDTDYLFSGKNLVGKILRPLEGVLKFVQISKDIVEIDLRKTIRKNREYIKLKEKITIKNIRRYLNFSDYDQIIVPWSGGKDSTLIIILLKKYKINFTAIYVDTGLEFEETKKYIEKISKKFNIKYEEIYAEIDKKYRELGYIYLAERMCTQDKIKSLYKKISEISDNPLIINGDRISESMDRSFRPDFRRDEFYVLSPIKYWSYLDEQLFFILNKTPINPLYKYGFYRVGCYLCPFTDSFEKFAFKRSLCR